MYKNARKAAGLTAEAAAFELHIATRTLFKIEAGETIPSPEVIMGMKKIYKNPWITQHYCKEECAIGKAYSYEILNNVNMDPASVLLKLVGEYKEAGAVLGKMLEISVNKNRRKDFTPEEWQEYMKCLHEFLDVEHNVECLKIALNDWCDISEEIQKHNHKCVKRGYAKIKKAL